MCVQSAGVSQALADVGNGCLADTVQLPQSSRAGWRAADVVYRFLREWLVLELLRLAYLDTIANANPLDGANVNPKPFGQFLGAALGGTDQINVFLRLEL